MSLLRRGLIGVRKMLRGKSTIGDWYRDSVFNPGSWSEDVARGLGVNTRRQGRVIGRTKVGTKQSIIGDPNELTVIDEPIFQNEYGKRRLNAKGYASQAAGWGGSIGLGAYMMSGGEETPAKDARGTPNKGFDEKRAKAVDDFKQKKLLGSSGFNAELYSAVSKDSQWVKTAVDNMGKERYFQLRKAAMNNPAAGQAVHDELIKALAKTADTKALEKAVKEPYVLPGLARTKDGKPRVVVISPVKGDDKNTSYTALQFDWQEPEGQE